MSIAQVRPYFQNILNDLGFTEHRDVLNYQNIDAVSIDRKYHIETVSINADAADHQTVYTYNYSLVVRIFKHAYNDPVGTLETLEADVDNVSCQILRAENRISGILLDVLPGVIVYQSIDVSNDNLLVAEMNFIGRIKVKYT